MGTVMVIVSTTVEIPPIITREFKPFFVVQNFN